MADSKITKEQAQGVGSGAFGYSPQPSASPSSVPKSNVSPEDAADYAMKVSKAQQAAGLPPPSDDEPDSLKAKRASIAASIASPTPSSAEGLIGQ